MLRTKTLIECFICSQGGEILQISSFGNISCKYKPCYTKCGFLAFTCKIKEIYGYYICAHPILLMSETDES